MRFMETCAPWDLWESNFCMTCDSNKHAFGRVCGRVIHLLGMRSTKKHIVIRAGCRRCINIHGKIWYSDGTSEFFNDTHSKYRIYALCSWVVVALCAITGTLSIPAGWTFATARAVLAVVAVLSTIVLTEVHGAYDWRVVVIVGGSNL